MTERERALLQGKKINPLTANESALAYAVAHGGSAPSGGADIFRVTAQVALGQQGDFDFEGCTITSVDKTNAQIVEAYSSGKIVKYVLAINISEDMAYLFEFDPFLIQSAMGVNIVCVDGVGTIQGIGTYLFSVASSDGDEGSTTLTVTPFPTGSDGRLTVHATLDSQGVPTLTETVSDIYTAYSAGRAVELDLDGVVYLRLARCSSTVAIFEGSVGTRYYEVSFNNSQTGTVLQGVLAPYPTSGDIGKVLTATNDGACAWSTPQ